MLQRGDDSVAWNDDSQKLVFQLFDKGQAERTIVRELSDKYKSNDKTVRRCLAGLRLVKASLEGRQRSPTEEKRFELLLSLEQIYKLRLESVP